MPKPELYGETIYLRVPKGTKDEIERLRRQDEKQADCVRRLLLKAIEEGIDPVTQPPSESDPDPRELPDLDDGSR